MSVAYAEAAAKKHPQAFRDRRPVRVARQRSHRGSGAVQKASYLCGFGFAFAAGLLKGLVPRAAGPAAAEHPAPPTRRASARPQRSRPRTGPPVSARVARLPAPPSRRPIPGPSLFVRARDWIRGRIAHASASIRSFIASLSTGGDGLWHYAVVTLAYWGLTITDGAIRMLVLFQFYLMGYSAFQI